MKRFSKVAILLGAVAVSVGYYKYSTRDEVKLPDLTLANVEALAIKESSVGYCTMHFPCFDKYGSPTGKYSASSYTGPGCRGSYHSHACSNCSGGV